MYLLEAVVRVFLLSSGLILGMVPQRQGEVVFLLPLLSVNGLSLSDSLLLTYSYYELRNSVRLLLGVRRGFLLFGIRNLSLFLKGYLYSLLILCVVTGLSFEFVYVKGGYILLLRSLLGKFACLLYHLLVI